MRAYRGEGPRWCGWLVVAGAVALHANAEGGGGKGGGGGFLRAARLQRRLYTDRAARALQLLELHLQRLRRRVLSLVAFQLRRVVRHARSVSISHPRSRAGRHLACRRARRRLLRGDSGAVELLHQAAEVEEPQHARMCSGQQRAAVQCAGRPGATLAQQPRHGRAVAQGPHVDVAWL